MPNRQLPVLYAVIDGTTMGYEGASEVRESSEAYASAAHASCPSREFTVIAYPPPTQLRDERLEEIGAIADSAANYHAASKLRLPPQMHATQLALGMAELRDRLRKLYCQLTGQNPWEDEPSEIRRP